MTSDSDRLVTAPETGRSPETIDRLMVAACGVIWLALLAVSVTATVALVDMGRAHTGGGEGKTTPWLLYTVIIVSALIIIGAIPLLLRARRAAQPESTSSSEAAARAAAAAPRTPANVVDKPADAPTEKIKIFGSTVDPSVRYQPDYAQSSASRRADPLIPATELDRLWLRCTVALAGAIGLALVGSETATYLLAVGKDTGAWVLLGVAGLITVAMPAVPVLYLRQLRGSVDTAAAARAE